jgi:hypothetical protein
MACRSACLSESSASKRAKSEPLLLARAEQSRTDSTMSREGHQARGLIVDKTRPDIDLLGVRGEWGVTGELSGEQNDPFNRKRCNRQSRTNGCLVIPPT